MQRLAKSMSGQSRSAPKPQLSRVSGRTAAQPTTSAASSAKGAVYVDESKRTQAMQRLAVGAARTAAAAVQRRSAADRAVAVPNQLQQRKLAAGNRQTALIYGRSIAVPRTTQPQATTQPQPTKVAAASRSAETKPKAKIRSYAVYGKQADRKHAKKSTSDQDLCLDLDFSVPIGPVQVVTKPRRPYNTYVRFFVPLSRLATPRDFQLLRPAGERYIVKLHLCKIEQTRQKAEMVGLVTATRPLLAEWLPLEQLLLPPPPPQFADGNPEDNVWKYRMQRNDTVTLCNFPTWERKLLVREYAGRLPVKYPRM